jgi:hypothetical protein
MSSQLTVTVDAAHTADRRSGSAARFGFLLRWDATWDGAEWLVEVPRGHALGPDGKGAFEVVTNDDWPAFAAAVQRGLQSSRDGRRPPIPTRREAAARAPASEEQSS